MAKDKRGYFKRVRAYDLQEWQTLAITGSKIISTERALNDPYRVLELVKGNDYYYTRNPMITASSGQKDNLRGISSIVIDIDNNNRYINNKVYIRDKENLEKRLNLNLVNKGLIPNYTTLVFSGTGIQLIYEIEQVSPKAEIIIKLIIKSLTDTIKSYLTSDKTLSMYQLDSVASNNITGLARLGGYNTKSGLLVTRQHTGIKYNLDTILERLGVAKSKNHTQSKASAKERLKADNRLGNTTIFLLKHRLKQIDIFKKLKEKQGLITGYRNTTLFLYANTVKQLTPEQADRLIIEYNKTFKRPLHHSEVRKVIKQFDNKTYKFKNETFNIWLEIDNHNKHLFRTGQIPRKAETIKKQKLREKEVIELLNNKELNNKQIADKLNVSDRTVRRYRKKYNIPNPFTN